MGAQLIIKVLWYKDNTLSSLGVRGYCFKIVQLNITKLRDSSLIARTSIQLNAKSVSRKFSENMGIIQRIVNMCNVCCLKMVKSMNE